MPSQPFVELKFVRSHHDPRPSNHSHLGEPDRAFPEAPSCTSPSPGTPPCALLERVCNDNALVVSAGLIFQTFAHVSVTLCV